MSPTRPLYATKQVVPAAFTLSLLFIAFASAGALTLSIPADKPAVSLEVPDSWKPEDTDKGIACESPDKVATIFLEVTSSEGVDALIDENVDWLTKDQGVEIDKSSEQKKDFETTGMQWKRVSWDATSKEWGPATVGFVFADVGNGKLLTVTYWITKKDAEKHFPAIEKIFESVKRLGS